MNPEDRFDECDPTDHPGIYEYYCEVFVDYDAFKNYEEELLEIQLNHPEYYLPFLGFWSEESDNKIFKLFEEYDENGNPGSWDFEHAKFKHRVNLHNNGYIYIRDEFLAMYPQFSDIFVGEVE